MNQIDVLITKKMFYSKITQKNDFFITITNGKTQNPPKISNNADENENRVPTIFISGLENLFKQSDSIDLFVEALNNGNHYWNISHKKHEKYGNCLEIKLNKINFYSDSFIVEDYEFTALSESNFDIDPKTIGIKVFFDNFDILYPDDMDNHVEKVDSIMVLEAPYIKELAAYYHGKKVEAVPNGEDAEIRWTLGNSNATAKLYDENDKELKSSTVTIDKNRKFKLIVKMNGKEVSQILPIQDAPFIENFYVVDSNNNKKKVMLDYEMAKIIWNVRCAENFSTTLYNERGKEVATTSGYEMRAKNTTYTLKAKKENIEVTQTLPIYTTSWFKDTKRIPAINNLFKPNEKGYNNFFYSERISIDGSKTTCPGHFIYVHPTIYFTKTKHAESDDFNWNNLDTDTYKDAPKDFIHYNSFYPSYSKRFVVCYTCKYEVTITPYDLLTRSWGTATHIVGRQREELDNNGTLLYCHYCEDRSSNGYLFAVYESFVKIYRLSGSSLLAAPWTIKIPSSEKDSTKIVSIDTIITPKDQKQYLAILCKREQNGNYNGNQVYVYDIESILKATTEVIPQNVFEYNEKEQKTLYCVNGHYSAYIVLDNCVFYLGTNKEDCLQDIYFSPTETIIEEKQGFMLIGSSDYEIQAIVQNGNETSNWLLKLK